MEIEGRDAKILIYDIETAPILGAVWGKYEQNLIWSIQDWYMLCFAYKWLGEKKTHIISQKDSKNYKPGSEDDSDVARKLRQLFDEADIIVAHNGNNFDQKKSNARMAYWDMGPPSPYKQVDTLQVARRYFKFTSNKLDDLGEHLGLGKKLETGGYKLWKGCMDGDKKSWKKMEAYNKQDVVLLEKVYLKLRPWMTNHPNMARIENRPESCPTCGANGQNLHARGTRTTNVSIYRRYRCTKCTSWCSGRKAAKKEDDIKPRYVNFNG